GRAYTRPRYAFAIAGRLLIIPVLLVLGLSSAGAGLRDAAARFAGARPLLTAAGVALALYLLLQAIGFPLTFYVSYLREKAFGLSTQAAPAWLWDYVKAAAIGAFLFVGAVAGWSALARRFPEAWPLPVWGAAVLLTVLLVAGAPVLIDPLFNTFTPLPEGDLRSRVRTLAERAGIEPGEILEADASRRTVKANAYVTGLLGTTRIVLYDTLGRAADRDVQEVVVAHELGHWRAGHIWKGIGLSAAGLFGLLWLLWAVERMALRLPWLGLKGAGDPATLPLLLGAAMVTLLLTAPVQHAVSRAFEREADAASLELAGKQEAYIRAEVALARVNRADLTPPAWAVFWFYTHPPVLERVAMGEAFHSAAAGGEPAR
ncbi:MAG: M48 family metallopeptidase, partial [candidate division NC10 bacterium]|nr:M48 family metallopeptidase [candidate division NC10 bacterium]